MKPDYPAAPRAEHRDGNVVGGGLVGSTSWTAIPTCSARTSPAPSTASHCPSSSRASSPSTRRTAPAHAARGSARSSRSTPTCSSPTRASRSRRGPRPVVARRPGVLRVRHSRRRRPVRDRPADALARPAHRRAGQVPARHGRRPDPRHVPQPDGAQAPVHDGVRRPGLEPPAPLPGDRLEPAAGADRGVHVDAALPGLPRRPPQARGARGHRRRQVDPRVLAAVRDRRAAVRRRARADADGGADRAAHPEGDPRAADVPRRRRRGLSEPRPGGADAVRRRGAAAAARDADRVAAGRRALHPRRAVDRPPSARQRPADRHARAAPRPRQHRARRRARRADDALGRLARRHGAGRGRARGRGGRRGHRRGGDGQPALGHRRLPLGCPLDRRAPRREYDQGWFRVLARASTT